MTYRLRVLLILVLVLAIVAFGVVSDLACGTRLIIPPREEEPWFTIAGEDDLGFELDITYHQNAGAYSMTFSKHLVAITTTAASPVTITLNGAVVWPEVAR